MFSQMHNDILRLVAFFFKENVINGVQLYDLQQEVVSYCQEFWNMKARADQHKP